MGGIVTPAPLDIGTGFKARHFNEEMFAGRMDPLLMVDHFVMTEPTFQPHLHAGISAVTFIFEDAEGDLVNRDSLGNHLDLKPGDLYWLAAASGAVHDERPAPGARTHALQIFVNLPARMKGDPARSIHVPAGEMPILKGEGYRVRLALGASNGVQGAGGAPQEMTILDGKLVAGARFTHVLPAGRSGWIYAMASELTVSLDGERQMVPAGRATTIEVADHDAEVVLSTETAGQFVLMAGLPIREPFVKAGPLVMSSQEDVRRTLVDYQAGRFGRIVGAA